MRRFALVLSAAAAFAFAGSGIARADTVGPITFEPPTYVVGDINGQNGWQKLNPLFDVKVVKVADYPAAAGYGFGRQALRSSDFYTSGTFSDQTFSPPLNQPAGEPPALTHFEGGFRIGTALRTEQTGLHMSVSPDDGNGGRMSYLRFEDQSDGVHVFFDDVTDPGPLPTVANFNETDIATLDRRCAHSIRFSIDFKTGPGNDVVKIYIDGKLKITGTTWEDYYRYDPEQTPNGNQVPVVRKFLFRESATPTLTNLDNGFLVDGVYLASSAGRRDCGRNDDSDRAEHDAYEQMNRQRAAAFLPPLTLNTTSSDNARKHSCDMRDGDGKGEHGSNGENVGYASDSSSVDALGSIEADLLADPMSSANILNPFFTQVGIGIVYLDDEMWLTEDFAS